MTNTLYNRRGIFILLLIASVSLGIFFLGCSDSSNDILPNLFLSVSSLDFGRVDIEVLNAVQTMTIRNLKSGNVTVERVTSTNPVFAVGGYYTDGQLINLEIPFTIESEGLRILYVGFYPRDLTEYDGKLVIESRDADSRLQTDLIALEGIGVDLD